MLYVLLSFAIIFLTLGHYFKTIRWQSFIETYEECNEKNLLRSLSLGYIINFVIPFRIGDIFRAIYSGKRMKNGVSFSLATIIVDRYLDILMVGFIFLILMISGFGESDISKSFIFYIIVSIILLVIIILSFILQKYIKIVIKKIANIFNENIELKIMKFSWSFITSFKDMIYNLDRFKLIFTTIIMWSSYLISYAIFALCIRETGNITSLVDVFTLLFSNESLNISSFNLTNFLDNIPITICYLFIPLILLIIFSIIPTNEIKKNSKKLQLLPQINPKDRLKFLEFYFSGTKREYIKNYLNINRDISIIRDYSAGSNATTILCTYDNKMFFRKYAFDSDSDKLYEQVKWIQKHSDNLTLTEICNIKRGKNYCYYDMPFIPDSTNFFNYVHSTSLANSFKLLKEVLNDLDTNLYTNVKPKDELIQKYIDTKVIENIKKIEKSSVLKSILKYDELIINGISYKNLKCLKKYLTKEYLYELFKNDTYSDIHGDLTIENIIYSPSSKKKYYIIDPNTGNIHNSPNLDFAKILQSLHGGYEFLMNLKDVDVFENNINYLYTKSYVYESLFLKYKEYLEKKYDSNQVKSIFFHEIIHWLRLMPYKIMKDENRSVIFYAGMIIVMNDIVNMYCGDENEK